VSQLEPIRVVDTDAHEGPVYVAGEHALYFTTVRRDEVQIKRVQLDGERGELERERVSVVRADANMANGMALDGEGRLVVCEQGTHERGAAITRMDLATGEVETVVDGFDGRPLNSPNDVVVARDGAIWFTDPSYGHLQGFRPQPALPDQVYRHDPRTGRTEVVADGFDKPNGIALSPDERVLYVTDSGRPHRVMAYDAAGGRVLAVIPGEPDGLKTDGEGRIYVSSAAGVRVLDPAGELLGEIHLPGAVNFCFGGSRRDVLFITTDDAVWAASTSKGA
jgi:gluconolactonase